MISDLNTIVREYVEDGISCFDTFHYKDIASYSVAQRANSCLAVSALIYRNTHIIKHIIQ